MEWGNRTQIIYYDFWDVAILACVFFSTKFELKIVLNMYSIHTIKFKLLFETVINYFFGSSASLNNPFSFLNDVPEGEIVSCKFGKC